MRSLRFINQFFTRKENTTSLFQRNFVTSRSPFKPSASPWQSPTATTAQKPATAFCGRRFFSASKTNFEEHPFEYTLVNGHTASIKDIQNVLGKMKQFRDANHGCFYSFLLEYENTPRLQHVPQAPWNKDTHEPTSNEAISLAKKFGLYGDKTVEIIVQAIALNCQKAPWSDLHPYPFARMIPGSAPVLQYEKGPAVMAHYIAKPAI